ncbi:HlyD family secretion protein [Rhizobium paknamense]|uniref:HlyD family secretion protein n=1 Tax=Rhizobium paknamense TaxID=1206817 RepID=A0ABU0ID38_9HYPH|nr:HlyD family efflux transporter periplasmic adaptor subunit [Rhizobium paknamense]MDQ0456165.1 HlyD family secretion protein [Rhizobium paknamense]
MRKILFSAVLLCLCVAAGLVWFKFHKSDDLPPGVAMGNGRIEATEVDVATKFAGRVLSVEVGEGDLVKQGQVLARIDAADIESQLRAARAKIAEAEQSRDAAAYKLAQAESQYTLADKDLERQLVLLGKGFVSEQTVDSQRMTRDSAKAAVSAAQSSLNSVRATVESASAEADRIAKTLADATLTAPKDGRVLYRLAEPGEVLAAGGKVLTLLDLSDVYMTIFLPSAEAGRTALGAEGRILLDMVPDHAVPGTVSFVSPQAQYTPKQVELRSERDRLMFRVKISVPQDLVRQYLPLVKTGVTGVGYVKTDPGTAWPERLESDLTRPVKP